MNLKIKILQALILFLIISLSGLSTIYGYQRFVTFIFIPIVLFTGFSLNQFSLQSVRNFYSRCFLIIIIWGLLLIPFSINIETAFINLQKLLGVYFTILITIEFLYFQKNIFLEIFLLSFVLAFFIIAFYILLGPDGGIEITSSYIDRSQFDLNANTYSYFSYFGNMALFYLILLTKRRVYIVLSIICLFLGVYISFVTASRSGILFTLIIGIIFYLFISPTLRKSNFLRFGTAILMFSFGISYFSSIYNNSYLRTRVENSIESGDLRETLTLDAINVFIDHPFTGVGPGQFYLFSVNKISFSHNSYTEMAANMGIIGIILLLILYIKPLWKEVKSYSYKMEKDLSRLNILFFSSFVLINNIYVFYLTTYGMIFLFIVIMIQKRIYIGSSTICVQKTNF